MSKKGVTNLENRRIKYVHCRNIDNDGKILGKGGLTAAYILDKDNKVVGYACAKCHENDNYNKYLGRAKATGRLRSGMFYEHCSEPMDELKFIAQIRDGYKKVFNAV